MLPIFHAASNFNYAKSVQIYLQDMVNIELTMTDDEYRRFKTQRDLKHGRGVTPSVIARFLSVMSSSFSIIECLEDYCSFVSSTSEQHVDLVNHRMKRDDDYIKKFMFWFEEHRPFELRTVLYSLSTGIVSMVTTDCHLAFEKGNKSMEFMVGKSVTKVSLSAVTCKVRILTAGQVQTHVNNDTCMVDSAVLFKRISILFHGDEVQTRKAFEFELSPHPLSLFDEFGLMRKTSKSELCKIFKPYVLQGQTSIRNMNFVIDGGFFLRNFCWPHGASFKNIMKARN
ncbi:uncharacterized protein LOC122520398 [Polistes fuscatus]|uniref:uncharacterized protein LOC122520398 n=1 Tax=Polistes fuscatus TaxID=30207 RepID=UPI001CA82C51|nr:uncharacterized protein LOC122520398 [Polistes fuscatus]